MSANAIFKENYLAMIFLLPLYETAFIFCVFLCVLIISSPMSLLEGRREIVKLRHVDKENARLSSGVYYICMFEFKLILCRSECVISKC